MNIWSGVKFSNVSSAACGQDFVQFVAIRHGVLCSLLQSDCSVVFCVADHHRRQPYVKIGRISDLYIVSIIFGDIPPDLLVRLLSAQ